jgi:hypothetical protein
MSFGVYLSPPLVDWYNQVARLEDLGSIKVAGVDLLGKITAGRRQIVFASAAEAERMVPRLADQFEIIGYDLEHWPMTPEDEKADPVAAVKRLRELADTYGLELALGPDRRFTMSHGALMAPYADRYVLQLQRVQENHATALGYSQPMIEELRQANPDLEISVVVRPDGNVEELLSLVDALKDDIDGVSILTTPATGDSVKAFVEALRSGQAFIAGETTPASETTAVAAATIAPTPMPTPTPEPLPTPTPSPLQCTCPLGIVLTGGGVAAGLLGKRKRSIL